MKGQFLEAADVTYLEKVRGALADTEPNAELRAALSYWIVKAAKKPEPYPEDVSQLEAAVFE
jgi:hypothetical protein